MKRMPLLLSTIALPFDYFALIGAGIVSYNLRYLSWITDWRPIIFNLPFDRFFPLLCLVSAGWLILFGLAGLYQTERRLKYSDEVRRIFLAGTAGLALIIVWFFFNQSLFASRFIVLSFWIISFIFMIIVRSVLRLLRNYLYKRGYALTRVLIIGQDQNAQMMAKVFQQSPALGYQVVGLVTLDQLNSNNYSASDELLVADSTLTNEQRLNIWEYANEHHLNFKYVTDIFNAQIHNVVVHTYAGLPIVEIKRTSLDGWGKVLKRLFDIIASLILLILLSPLFLIISLIILLKYGRPIIVALNRVGEGGELFVIHKFRSMVVGAERMKQELLAKNERNDGPLFKISADPRITNFGKFIRAWSLDELPQFWDVLLGQMSLVGPRPHEPGEVAKYQSHHHKVLNIKPGITGLAQISGRSSLSFEDEVRLDSFYVENWSLGHDLLILLKTLVVIFQRRDAV